MEKIASDPGVIVSLIALFGVIAGNCVTLFVFYANLRKDIAQRQEDTRIARKLTAQEKLYTALRELIDLFSQFQALIVKSQHAPASGSIETEVATVIGKAIGILVSTGNSKLQTIAVKQLVPYLVSDQDDPGLGDWRNRNRNALIEAIQELALLTAN